MQKHLDEIYERKEFGEGIFLISNSIKNSIHTSSNLLSLLPSIRGNRTRCYNIDPTLQMKHMGPTYLRDSTLYLDSIHSLISIGYGNSLLAIIDIDGNIHFMEQTLLGLPIEYELGDKLDKILGFRNKKCGIYKFEDFDEYRIDMIGCLLSRIVSEANLSVNSIYGEFERLTQELLFQPDSSLTLLANTNKIYRNCIAEMLRRQRERYDNMFQRALRFTTMLISSLEKVGYLRIDSHKWEKIVMIVPPIFISNGKYYKMTESQSSCYWVKSMKIDLIQVTSSKNLTLICDAKHPNIDSDGNFCTGYENQKKWAELTSSFDSTTSADIEEFLIGLEKTIHMINFDSSFWGTAPSVSRKEDIEPVKEIDNLDLYEFDKDRIRSF